jgi:ribosome-associated protein
LRRNPTLPPVKPTRFSTNTKVPPLDPLMRIVDITKEPVELYKILKFEGLVTSGGEAKLLIGDGQVSVNGEIETRRRKKIVDADIIEFRGEKLQMRLV